jgi:hypothetical protein
MSLQVKLYSILGGKERRKPVTKREPAPETLARRNPGKAPQAVSLSIGNHIFHVYAPWRDWYNLIDAFLKAPDPPDYLHDTRGTRSYEKFFNQMEHIRKHCDVYIVVTI